MNKHASLPRLLEPLVNPVPWYDDLEEFKAKRDPSSHLENAVWLNDTVLAFVKNISYNTYNPRIYHAGRFDLYDTFDRPLETVMERGDYSCLMYPRHVTGNGLPKQLHGTSMYLYQDSNHVIIQGAMFLWYDTVSHVHYLYSRHRGPAIIVVEFLKVTKDGVFWNSDDVDFFGIPRETDLYKRMQQYDIFDVPFFSDPQDELEYQLVTS